MRTLLAFIAGNLVFLLCGLALVAILAGAQSVFGLDWHATLGICMLLFLAAAIRFAR